MLRKTKLLFFCISIFFATPVILFAVDEKTETNTDVKKELKQEAPKQDAGKPEEIKAEAKKPEVQAPRKHDTQIKKVVPDKEKASSKITEKAKLPDGPVLKNPGLTDEFRESYESSPMENGFGYFFYGAFTGGIMGMAGGLAFYKTNGVYTPLFVSAGVLGAAGGVTGLIISILERSSHNPTIGAKLLDYSWYGLFGGATIGALVGIIPYSSGNNTIALLNYVGYGAFGGLAAGVTLYFLAPKSSLKNLVLDINPLDPKIGYRYQF